MDVVAIIKVRLNNFADPEDLEGQTLLSVTQEHLQSDGHVCICDADDSEVLAADFVGEPVQLSLDSALQAQELRAVESFFKGGLS